MPSLLHWLDRTEAGRAQTYPRQRFPSSPAGALAGFVARKSISGCDRRLAAHGGCSRRARIGSDRFETDFTKMRSRDTWIDGDGYWGARMDVVLGQRLNPVAILSDSAQQTLVIEDAIRQAATHLPLSDIVGEVRSFRDIVPDDRQTRRDSGPPRRYAAPSHPRCGRSFRRMTRSRSRSSWIVTCTKCCPAQ